MSDRKPSAAYQRVQAQWAEAVRAMNAMGDYVTSELAKLPQREPSPYRTKKGPRFGDRAGLVRFHANKRRAAKLKRTPAWADLDAMRGIYAEASRLTAETGIQHHVDHVIPLQGALVSGLHVPNNLQILTGSENSKKRNRYEV